MYWFPRLVAKGPFGRVSPPPFSYDLTSQKYFAAAKKNGGLKNLVRLRGLEDLQEENELDNAAALVLASRTTLPASWNGTAAWTDALGGTAMSYVESLPNVFGGRVPGLGYYNNGVSAGFLSTFSLEENQPFCLRLYLFEPKDFTEEEKDDLDAAGLDPRNLLQLGFDDWVFSIVDGNFEIARKSSQWTTAKQIELNQLLDIAEPTEAQQTQIDNLIGPRRVEAGGTSFPDAIYDIHQSLSLGSPVEKQIGKYYELFFHPEPRGRLNIQLAGGTPQSIDVPEILSSRATGTIYGSTRLSLFTSGQTFLWQTGHSSFRPIGSLRIGPFKTGYWTSSMGAALLTAIRDQSLPGTSVTIEHIVHNSAWFSFKVTAKTTNPKFSPFLYGAQANLVAGVRSGSTDVAWDSSAEESRVLSGLPAIADLQPSCEGSPAMRRQQWQVIIKDPTGRALETLTTDDNCEALENRIVDLSAGEALETQTKILSGGLAIESQINDAARARYDTGTGVLQTLRRWLLRENAQLTLTVADACAILDEDLMTESPIGDGMRLGAYLRLLLKNGGWSDAEVAGVSALAGRVLPSAALGESPCVRPARDVSRGEYIRGLIERYGLGWRLWIDEHGVWQFGPRSTSIKQINGHDVAFVATTAHNDYSWPARFAILSPLDHIRDPADFYNYFRVEGWVDPLTGQRLADEHIIHESIAKSSVWASLKYIGRVKRYQTLRDEGLRTPDDIQYALRSLVELYGRSARHLQFETYFHIGLQPGDLVTVDGLLCEVVSVAGSLAKDRMTLVVMELGGSL